MSDWLGMLASPRTPRPELKARVLARALAARGRPMAAYAAAAVMGAVAVGAGVWTAGRMRALEAARSALERR
ncbi:MAG TPA: hypothetical protein VNI61_11815, partial [Gemmatimonadales bacterium]|nr:hypothetical protein [Gemmatimonadales bacterium]